MENNLWWTFATTLQPLEGSVSQENLRGELNSQVFICSEKGSSFSGGISSSEVDTLVLSVFLNTSSIYLKTAGTAVWHQSKIQWQNHPSCVLRFLGGKLQLQVFPAVRCSGPVREAPPQTTLTGILQLYILKQWPRKKGPNTRLHSWWNDCSSSSFVFYVALNNKPKRQIKKVSN